MSPLWSHLPTERQTLGLIAHRFMPTGEPSEVFYGGAAGGGKSDWLLMGALEYVDVPGYAAIVFRRTFTDLALPGAIMARAHEWLAPHAARGVCHWSGQDKRWTFESGATLQFAYMEHANDELRYQSAEFQYVAFDELTHFPEQQYRYMFSRLRRPAGGALSQVPLRMRSASNPGGPGHDWVRGRFIDEPARSRVYVPAKLSDNPHVDRDAYIRSLAHLDPVTRQRLLEGDWSVREPGGFFQREWFGDIVDRAPLGVRRVRFWDLAATVPTSENPDPDWTVGLLLAEMGGRFWVEDVIRVRVTPKQVEALVSQTASVDGPGVPVRMEQEPGSSGKTVVEDYRRRVLAGYDFQGKPSTGSKEDRARPVSSRVEAGDFQLARGPWNREFLDELEAYTGDLDKHAHDDQVDALSGAYRDLTFGRDGATTVRQSHLDEAPRTIRIGDMTVGEEWIDEPAGRRNGQGTRGRPNLSAV